MIKFDRLGSCGIIANYVCSSKCRHCMYASSPEWPKDYMEAGLADEIFRLLREHGCRSVHIGGGEPLLRPDRLLPVLDAAAKNGVGIEYIETNASWYRDEKRAGEVITDLRRHHVETLLISVDPYHNEYVPFRKIKGLIAACERYGMGVFLWRMEFWDDLEAAGDDSVVHSLEEYEEIFGDDYRLRLAQRYHLNLRGRALQTYREHLRDQPVEELFDRSSPCRELLGIHHFHVDLYGNFVPPACSGISLDLRDAVAGADPEKYPVYRALVSSGIKGLYEYAAEYFGYTPKESYKGKCDLCYDIRSYLVLRKNLNLPDLQPTGHYFYM
jgi:hypothetical protein